MITLMLTNFAGRQVQVFPRCRQADHRQGGRQVPLQGCWCQHPPWCCRRWCPVHLRPGPAHPLRQEVQGWFRLNAVSFNSDREKHTVIQGRGRRGEDGVDRVRSSLSLFWSRKKTKLGAVSDIPAFKHFVLYPANFLLCTLRIRWLDLL